MKKKTLQFADWKVNIWAYIIVDIFEAVYNTQNKSIKHCNNQTGHYDYHYLAKFFLTPDSEV